MTLKGKDLKRGIIRKIHANFKEKVLNSEARQDFKEPYFLSTLRPLTGSPTPTPTTTWTME